MTVLRPLEFVKMSSREVMDAILCVCFANVVVGIGFWAVSWTQVEFVWFSSPRTVVWLSFPVSVILFFSSMRFLVLLSVSGFVKFYKNLNFNSKFGRHSFSVICSFPR